MAKIEEVIRFKIIPKTKKDLNMLNFYLAKNKVLYTNLDLYISQKNVDDYECKISKELKKVTITYTRNTLEEN